MDLFATPVQFIKGIGPKRAQALTRLGINNAYDLLWHLPREYQDRNAIIPVVQARSGEVMLMGQLDQIQNSSTRRGFKLVKGTLTDSSGSINLVWFNQAYLARVLKSGSWLLVRGKVNYGPGGSEISVYEHEVVEPGATRRMVPVYPLVEGVSQHIVRDAVEQLLSLPELDYPQGELPKTVGLPEQLPIIEALRGIHLPTSPAQAESCRRRLALEEFLLLQLALLQVRKERQSKDGIAHLDATGVEQVVRQHLPFALTAAQERVIDVIKDDMAKPKQMNRLLQGDVGSGKTVVAALAAAMAIGGGYQVAIMAPTEILASQHLESLQRFLNPAGAEVCLLTGSMTAKERRNALTAFSNGEVKLAAGTHALIQEGVDFYRLGLVIIDEQHRFGVKQRATLAAKGSNPDILVMTATPIPRTLALTVYGDLAVSVIDELPPGRKPIKTFYIPQNQMSKVYELITLEVNQGRQVYVVCPLVEESEKQDLQDATGFRELLANEVFPNYKVALLHGRMDAREKEQVMQAMAWGEIDILVTTTVVEVGVDIPNASIMVVMHGERFGLSQLHQLRGRVGRGAKQSYCLLVSNNPSDEARQRLTIMERSEDGFEIAKQDLMLRGPGEFWGTRQHGLPEFKAADLLRDTDLLETSKVFAQAIFKQDPRLEEPEHRAWDYLNKKMKNMENINHN